MILRITHKLAKKIDALDALNELPLSENPYLDWSANIFRAQRVQYIIFTNTSSLYSMIMFGRGIVDISTFIGDMTSTMRDFLKEDGFEVIYRRIIAPNRSPILFAKSLNRSVTGSMNDFISQAKYHIENGNLSPWDTSFRVNDVPMSFLNYSHPRKVFKSMAPL